MTRARPVARPFSVFGLVFAMTAAMLLVRAAPVRAQPEEPCTGASSITDFGTYYLVEGTSGSDWIDCYDSDKPVEIHGGFGDDHLWGSAFGDVISGGWGNDSLYGGQGDDWLSGGKGNDWLYGGDGNDLVDGGQGNDYLAGENGYDVCLGGPGDDSVGGPAPSCDVLDLGPGS